MKDLNNIVNDINIEKKEQKFEQNFDDSAYESNIDTLDDDIGVFNIKIFGVGGAGCNVVRHLVTRGIWPKNVQIFAQNTDVASLKKLKGLTNLHLLGKRLLNGAGSGGNPEIGKKSAEEDIEKIKTTLANTDILFIVAGLGKGTGSGASPVIAKAARELGILTIGIVNLPSIHAEGQNIYRNALQSYDKLAHECDSITYISNDRIIKSSGSEVSTSFVKAFEKANEEVMSILNEIVRMITIPTEMNIDFSDVKNFFKGNSLFMCNTIIIPKEYSKESLETNLDKCIENSFTDIKFHDAKKALINYIICDDTPSSIISDTRNIFKEKSGNSDLDVVAGVDYTGKDKIVLSFLLSASVESNNNANQKDSKLWEDQKPLATKSVPFPEYEPVPANFNENSTMNVDQYKSNHGTTKIEKEKFDFSEEDFINHEKSTQYINDVTKAVTNILKNSPIGSKKNK